MKRCNERWACLAAAIVLAAALGAGCNKGADARPDAPAGAGTARQKLAVRFAKSEARPLPQTLEISGTLAANETSEVAAQAAGVVIKVTVDVGERVKKGDTLVVLDARNAQLQSAAAGAAVAQAKARLAVPDGGAAGKVDPDSVPEVRAAKEAMILAKADLERTKQLFDQGALPQATMDQARTRAETASAQYEAAVNGVHATVAQLTSAQAQAGLAGKALSDTTVRAPFDGALAERRISVGEFANVGRVVGVLVSDNPLRLRIDVGEADIASIELGKAVEVSVAAYPGKMFPGVIKRIGASVKASSRMLPVEAEIDNTEGKLRPGFFAQGQITLGGEVRPAVLVPEAAVGTSGTSARLFVRSGDRVVERLVKKGRKVGELVEVIGPIQGGEDVAVEKVEELSDGAEITPAS